MFPHRGLQQQVEYLKCPFPILGRGVLYGRIYELEGVGKGHAQSARDVGKLGLGLGADRQMERWPGGDMIQDRLQLDILVECAEGLDALLQTFGDRQVVGLDDVASIRLGSGLSTKQQIVDLLVDEVAVAPQILLVDVADPRPRERSARTSLPPSLSSI